MKKVFTWSTTHEFKLEAEYSEKLVEKVYNLDGDIINTGKMEKVESASMDIYVDGKKYGGCWNTNFWKIIDTEVNGIKRIWGIQGIGFNIETAEKIEKFIEEVIAEGKNEDVTAFEEEERIKEALETISRREVIVKKAEKQSVLPSSAEAKAEMKRYNDLNNDGMEGYVPYIVSREEYERATKEIEELKKSINI